MKVELVFDDEDIRALVVVEATKLVALKPGQRWAIESTGTYSPKFTATIEDKPKKEEVDAG